ncbi:MAG: M1 family metallopeptidase [Bacteroidia bacterium]
MRVILVVFVLVVGCGLVRQSPKAKKSPVEEALEDTTFSVRMEEEEETKLRPLTLTYPYQGTPQRRFQLIHTALDLELLWEKSQIAGQATLWVTPYFYSQDTLFVDAKSFEIEQVQVAQKGKPYQNVAYVYNNEVISIRLPRKYTAGETLMVYIKYIAKPEEISQESGQAITGRKGGYFINPLGEDPCKPRQFWTQGEPESASAWFPTLDKPSQKSTQELCITVEDSLVTLSNGLLVSQRTIAPGKRQDCWALSQPHAPYLFALIVGNFKVYKDSWRGKEVSYYLEPTYAPYAKVIFGNTPRMLEFYSTLLRYPYPWPKFSQVVVRDFVSGAMENTTAVVHSDVLHYDDIAIRDRNQEDVIAHELFHHWFGDLVTCESWSHIGLNENFATYGEYLWKEHAYGKEEAELHRRSDLLVYLSEARQKREPIIRYRYVNIEDLFDAHSYQKGGLVLHVLREKLGDSAFFAGLHHYLKTYAYQTVEIHDLRRSFERVSGRDLEPFFSNYYLRAGHPEVEVEYTPKNTEIEIRIRQKQDSVIWGLWELEVPLEIRDAEGIKTLALSFSARETTFVVPNRGVRYVDYDPKRLIIGEVRQQKPLDFWKAQAQEAPTAWQRIDALENLSLSADDPEVFELAQKIAKEEPFKLVRLEAMEIFRLLSDDSLRKLLVPFYVDLARGASEVGLRAEALRGLSDLAETYPEVTSQVLELAGISLERDTSYRLWSEALQILARFDTSRAVYYAEKFLHSLDEELSLLSCAILIRQNNPKGLSSLMSRLSCYSLQGKILGISYLSQSIGFLDPAQEIQVLNALMQQARAAEPWFVRFFALRGLLPYRDRPEIKTFLQEIKSSEKHPRLRELYEQIL